MLAEPDEKPEARRGVLNALVEQGKEALARTEGEALTAEQAEAREVLETVLGQDTEPDPQGGVRIREGVATDRVRSGTDSEMWHGHKKSSGRLAAPGKRRIGVRRTAGSVRSPQNLQNRMPDKRVLTHDDRLNKRTPASARSVAISPDGRYVACAVQRSGDLRYRQNGAVPGLWDACRLSVIDTESGDAIAVAPGVYSAWDPMWSPDGHRLAFVAAEKPEGPVRLCVWSPGESSSHRITDRPVLVHGQPRWFPDSRRMCVPLISPTGTMPTTSLAHDVVVFDSPASSESLGPGAAWLRAELGAVETETGLVEPLVEGRPALEGFPSPNGRDLLWAEAPTQPDPARYVARLVLHLHRADGWRGAVGSVETSYNWSHWQPHWSPDGLQFAAVVDGSVAVWDVARPEQPRRHLHLPSGLRADGWLAWTADGTGLAVWAEGGLWLWPCLDPPGVAVELRAQRHRISGVVRRLDSGALPPGDITVLAGGEIQRLGGLSGANVVAADLGETTGFSPAGLLGALGDATSDGSRFVFAVGDPGRRTDLWLAYEGGQRLRRLTDLNPHLDEIREGTWHEFRFCTLHGDDAGAQILTPPGWQPGTRCPTVVGIYPGAPAKMLLPVEPQLLAANGYSVLVMEIPYDPAADADPIEAWPAAVLPAVSEAVRLGYSDEHRLAVMGQSMGGMAVLGLLSRTGRFRAAIADSAPTHMASSFGQMHVALERPADSGSVAWCETGQGGMGGPPWERPLRYVVNSPVYFLDRITTPLLLLAGTDDGAVPWTQSGEVFVGMRRLGRTCTLAVYRGEGHTVMGWSEPNRRDAVDRIFGWLQSHLAAGG